MTREEILQRRTALLEWLETALADEDIEESGWIVDASIALLQDIEAALDAAEKPERKKKRGAVSQEAG